MSMPKIDIDKPKFDQETFIGRAKHFFLVTNPMNLLASDSQLQQAKRIVEDYKAGRDVPEINTLDDVWQAKYLYDSAFHPETKEKQLLIGRMSAQVPCNTLLNVGMMMNYNSKVGSFVWQWLNQSFNAIVNYTNRSGTSTISTQELLGAYFMATGGACTTVLALNKIASKLPILMARFVPFMAAIAASYINIPMMRSHEIRDGIVIFAEEKRQLGTSHAAAKRAIDMVVISRILMAVPALLFTPIIVHRLERGLFKRYPKLNMPIQVAITAFFVTLSTPLGCACFQQQAKMPVSKLEPEVREDIQRSYPHVKEVTFYKGL